MKIITKNKIIIFLLMILCAFSVFGKEKEKKERIEKKKDKEKIEKVVNTDDVKKKNTSKKKSEKTEKGKKTEKTEKTESSSVKVVAMVSGEGVFSKKTISKKVDNIKMLLKGKIGSFQLYAVDSYGAEVPLLAGYDEFTSSFVSLLVDKKEYRLSDKIGIIIGAREKEDGAQLVYVVQDVARVLLDFTCIPATSDYAANVLRVDVFVENKGKETKNFGIKNVLDTYLGEHEHVHFTAGDGKFYNHEIQYRKMNKLKWIYSGNSKAGMQVLLEGADITSPEVLSLSNKDVLALPAWIPDLVEGRPFDSVFSYNNSAICMNWENLKIKPNEEKQITYYIAFTTKNQPLVGEEFLKYFGQVGGYNPVSSERKNSGSRKISEWTEDEVLSAESKANAVKAKSSKELPVEKVDVVVADEKKDSNVQVDEKSIEKEKLNYEYIQQLVDKINKLESSNSSIDKNELFRLNTELDIILDKLRQ